MLDYMLDFIFGSMHASAFQSVAQLAVAVSLAYVVAGPDVSRLLRTKFSNFANLEASLSGIQAEGGTGIDAPSRRVLLENAKRFVDADAMRTAPANAATTRFYLAAAAVSFATLVYCTFWVELPRYVAIALVAGALVALLRDPWIAASRASQLQQLMDEVQRIARTFNPNSSTAPSSVIRASGVIADLELQSVTLKDGISRLKAI